LAEKISIEWRKKIKWKEEDDFFGVFPKKRQKQAAYAAKEEDSEVNPGTNEISVFRTNEISADNHPVKPSKISLSLCSLGDKKVITFCVTYFINP